MLNKYWLWIVAGCMLILGAVYCLCWYSERETSKRAGCEYFRNHRVTDVPYRCFKAGAHTQ